MLEKGIGSSLTRKEKPDVVVILEIKTQVVDSRFVGSVWKSRFVN